MFEILGPIWNHLTDTLWECSEGRHLPLIFFDQFMSSGLIYHSCALFSITLLGVKTKMG